MTDGVRDVIKNYLVGHKVEVTDGKKIWYVAELSGLIMEVDIEVQKLKCIWKIPNSIGACAYRLLFYDKHKLYIFPYSQSDIYIYDLRTAEYAAIKVKNNPELMGCIKRGHFLYVFGNKAEIIKFDINERTVSYIDMQTKRLDFKTPSQNWFWTNSYILNEKIHIPLQNSNILIILDREDNVSSVCLGEKPEKRILDSIYLDYERYCTIYCKKEYDTLITYIAEYDLSGRLLKEKSVKEEYNYRIYPFLCSIWDRENWLCLPFGRNEILIRNTERDKMIFKIENGAENVDDVIQGLFYCSVRINDDMICSINQASKSLICVNLKNWIINYSPLKLEIDYCGLTEKGYRDAFQHGNVISEIKDLYDIKSFIDFICKHEKEYIN